MPKDCGFKYGDLEFESIEDLKRHFINNVPKETLLSNIKKLPNATQQSKGVQDKSLQAESGKSEHINPDQREQKQTGGTEAEQGTNNSYSYEQRTNEQKEEIADDNMDDENEYVGNSPEVDKLNEQSRNTGNDFDKEKFSNNVLKQLGKGYTEEDVIDFYRQQGFELSDEQKEIVYDLADAVPKITAADEASINDFQKSLSDLKSGKRFKSVAKRLSSLAAIHELTNQFESSDIFYSPIKNSDLVDLVNNFYDRIGVDGALDFINNQKANSPLLDMRVLLQTKVFSDLLKEGRKEEAAKMWAQMADESTLMGRNINSISVAYSLLNAGNVDAQMKSLAMKRLAERTNAKLEAEQNRINTELGEQGVSDVQSVQQKSIDEINKDATVRKKIENFINRICKRK